MSATSADPQNSPLTYAWTFGDGATANGASVTHAYQADGQYNPAVTVSNQLGMSSSATASTAVFISTRRPQNFPIFDTNAAHFLGETLVVQAGEVARDFNGLPITYAWTFGDGASAIGARASHVYAAPGTYTVRLTVTNTDNGASTAQLTAQVFAQVSAPLAVDNTFAPYCSGAFCGASSPGTYSGFGTGIWRYRNSTNTDALLNIAIQGVRSGQVASLVFTNGGSADLPTLPGYGALMSAASSANAAAVAISGPADAHALMLQKNLDQALLAIHAPAAAAGTVPVRPQALRLSVPPALGTVRVWNDLFAGVTPYTMEVAATCSLPTGRNAVFWLDSTQLGSGVISRARIQFLLDGLCGPGGAYARQVALTGDIWGPQGAAKGYIPDAASAPQDLHIVIPGVPTSSEWGGYFSAINLRPISDSPVSNAQIAIFINAYLVTRTPQDNLAGATMLHELKHLINFYQRSVVRNSAHSTWLEETSAMLSEDLFTEAAIGFNRAELRHDGYVFSGGGIGYLHWAFPDGQSYNQGGSFGAFLHRRYGLDVDRRLVDTCSDNGNSVSSYQCVDALIKAWGGQGFEDEFARQGASVFGGMSWSEVPSGFGYPSIVKEGVFLKAFSSASVTYPPARISPRAISQFEATMHAYRLDTIAAGQTAYRRDGVVVPAGATLMLVIK